MNKTNRHTITFIAITVSSVLLIPALQAGFYPIIWILFGIILLSNLTNLLIA